MSLNPVILLFWLVLFIAAVQGFPPLFLMCSEQLNSGARNFGNGEEKLEGSIPLVC